MANSNDGLKAVIMRQEAIKNRIKEEAEKRRKELEAATKANSK